MSDRVRRVLPHLVMLVITVLLYWLATKIDTRAAEEGHRIGPDFWPKLVIVIMGVLCAYEVVKRLIVKSAFTAEGLTGDRDPPPGQRAASEVAADGEAVPPPAGGEHPRRLLAGIVLIGAFALGVDWLGFFVATALFLTLFILIGGLRRPLLATAIGVVGSFALIVIFMRVAYISLPLGAGPFRELSLALLRLLGVS
ncbi:MAG: tripartite tricarboxylate transporter TctB family protein [Burkholderiales bacterium]|nr:tripartite tricarboxylate transporter TctB family protein [Burkholderiales bacterium]